MDGNFTSMWNTMMPRFPLEIIPATDTSPMKGKLSKELLASPFTEDPHIPLLSWLEAFSDKDMVSICSLCGTTEGAIPECEVCEEGEVSCEDCGGEAEVDCRECGGQGHLTCEECDGVGEIDADCGPCDGRGEMREDCEACDDAIGEVGYVQCEDCDGLGEDDDGKECKTCEGEMQVKCEVCEGRGDLMATCEECDGGGIVPTDCDYCNGEGVENCGHCWDGRVECGECEDGLELCGECGGAWRRKACERHILMDTLFSPQPQVTTLQSELNLHTRLYGNKLKFKIVSFNNPESARIFAEKSNYFCYVAGLDKQLQKGILTETMEAAWRISLGTNLEFPAEYLGKIIYSHNPETVNTDEYCYFIASREFANLPTWGYYAWKEGGSQSSTSESKQDDRLKKELPKGNTLVIRTNISLKSLSFMNWQTSQPWIS